MEFLSGGLGRLIKASVSLFQDFRRFLIMISIIRMVEAHPVLNYQRVQSDSQITLYWPVNLDLEINVRVLFTKLILANICSEGGREKKLDKRDNNNNNLYFYNQDLVYFYVSEKTIVN